MNLNISLMAQRPKLNWAIFQTFLTTKNVLASKSMQLILYCFISHNPTAIEVYLAFDGLSSYHSTSCHVNKDTFPTTQIGTMEKHKISSEIIDWKCSSILEAHALWQEKTKICWHRDIFSPGSTQHQASYTGTNLMTSQDKSCNCLTKKILK